jgi:hypothetical protein
MPTVWTAGHNMPGYLPEGDVVAFETRLEALKYTADELRQAAERLYEIELDSSETLSAQAAEYEQAADALDGRDADTDGDWYDTFEDGRIAYWFMSIDMTDEEAREALEGDQ